jgi:ribosome-associated protein
VVLDLTGTTPIVDYFVITTGASPRQMRAVADEVRKTLKAAGQSVISSEGEDSGSWILNDFGDIVLHVFSGESRRLYDLENLWADARQVDWAAELAAAGELRPQ